MNKRIIRKTENQTENKPARRVIKKAEKKNYIPYYLPLDKVVYIGTNNKDKTTEFFKNSQYLVFKDEDAIGTEYTYKIDLKTARVDTETNRLYISKDKDSEILITTTLYEEKLTMMISWGYFLDIYEEKQDIINLADDLGYFEEE